MPGGHPAQPGARGNQESEMGSGLGRRAHLEHDRHPPRLVHLPPAHLGRAHRRVSVRGLRQALERSRPESQSDRAVRARRRRRLVHDRRPTPWSRQEPSARKCGNTKFAKETDILDVWFESGSQPRRRARSRTRPALAGRSLPRRRRPAPRLVPLFPALRRRHARPRAVSHGRHQRLDARRTGPRHVEVAAATTSIRSTSPTAWAARSCACGWPRSISAKTWSAPSS